jgi:hypothetical protein
MDQSKAFPKKVNMEQYMPLVKAALEAAKGEDGLPRVVVEDYDTYQQAVRASNSIRNHARANNLDLRVSCPENGKSVYVYKSKMAKRQKKKVAPPAESAAVPATMPVATATEAAA